MVASEFLKARLPLELKRRVKAHTERQLLTESVWLKRLVIRELQATEDGLAGAPSASSAAVANLHRQQPKERARSSCRIYVRLRHDDELLLKARATARGMRPATYVSALTRSHLRALAPLPKDELLALKRSIGELAAIGRNLNQIARAANEGTRFPSFAKEEFRAMLKVCEALRDNTKSLLKANLTSWENGYGEDL
jgi:hypothetical protein